MTSPTRLPSRIARWLRRAVYCLLPALVPLAAGADEPLQPFSMVPESESALMSGEPFSEEFCESCLTHEPGGWSPLPARHDDDWGEHYRPLFGWVSLTPLALVLEEMPEARYTGQGRPLERSSWLNQPYHTSAGIGSIWAGQLSSDVESDAGLLGIVRLGRDTTPYSGWESRFAWTGPSIHDSAGTVGPDASGEFYLADLNAMFYPWGDSQWRPYTSMGLGLAYYRYGIDATEDVTDVLISVPLGVGLKYRHSSHLAFRLELTDYLTFAGSEQGFRNNLTATAGLEWHFGGRRPNYWPWQPGRQ